MDAKDVISLKGNLKINDYYFTLKSSLIFINIIFILLSYIFVLRDINFSKFSIINVIEVIVSMVVACCIISSVFIFRYKRIFNNSNLGCENVFVVDESGITRIIEKVSLFVKWNDILKIVEGKDCFRIYVKNEKSSTKIPSKYFKNENNINDIHVLELRNPIFLPKRFFEDETMILKFKELAKL